MGIVLFPDIFIVLKSILDIKLPFNSTNSIISSQNMISVRVSNRTLIIDLLNNSARVVDYRAAVRFNGVVFTVGKKELLIDHEVMLRFRGRISSVRVFKDVMMVGTGKGEVAVIDRNFEISEYYVHNPVKDLSYLNEPVILTNSGDVYIEKEFALRRYKAIRLVRFPRDVLILEGRRLFSLASLKYKVKLSRYSVRVEAFKEFLFVKHSDGLYLYRHTGNILRKYGICSLFGIFDDRIDLIYKLDDGFYLSSYRIDTRPGDYIYALPVKETEGDIDPDEFKSKPVSYLKNGANLMKLVERGLLDRDGELYYSKVLPENLSGLFYVKNVKKLKALLRRLGYSNEPRGVKEANF